MRPLSTLDVFGIAIIVLGAWHLARSFLALSCGSSSKSWPTSRGVVHAARVIEKRNRAGKTVHRHALTYIYPVGGKYYRASRIKFGVPNSFLWLDPGDATFRQFRRKAQVPVRYSPDWPSISTLQTGHAPFVFLRIAIASGLAWFGYTLLNLPG